MDAPGNEPVRRYLMEHARLLSAVRLPNNLFTEYAGTEVASDLVVLQKQSEKRKLTPDEQRFVSSSEIGNGIYLNDYHRDFKHAIHTTFSHEKGLYGQSALVLHYDGGPERIAERLRGAPESLKEQYRQMLTKAGESRYDKIVSMIEQSEQLKSAAESHAANLADKLVPYTLIGSALSYALTRNVTRALSVLMVDFSCALKLAMPLAVLSAMREASMYHITVKGGKFLEAVAQADTIVFDKTGTLTHACPVVARVIPFGGHSADDMLRVAACLEEHFPHSMANAVVRAARERDLAHEDSSFAQTFPFSRIWKPAPYGKLAEARPLRKPLELSQESQARWQNPHECPPPQA